jgi:hypothetical protein
MAESAIAMQWASMIAMASANSRSCRSQQALVTLFIHLLPATFIPAIIKRTVQ